METTSKLDPLAPKVLQKVRNIESRGYRVCRRLNSPRKFPLSCAQYQGMLKTKDKLNEILNSKLFKTHYTEGGTNKAMKNNEH